VINAANFEQHAAQLRDVEVIFATWGMLNLSDEQLARLPQLKAVFYAAGNVKAFAAPLLNNDIKLISAWAINAIPVAEMCLSQILLSLRGYFRSVREYRRLKTHEAKNFPRPGVSGEAIGLIGLGKIGLLLRQKLHDYPLKVLAYDPFLTVERAIGLDVEPVTLQDMFKRAYIVSNHIPDLADTKNVLSGELFASMREGATFINTGRGAQVVEEDLIEVLKQRPDLTALLDVSWPEPPEGYSELWTLPNVVISPHIGGTIGDEVIRLADAMIEEFEAWDAGKGLRYEVTPEVFATMG
jgi:phosphoglycerate dehydrogenase-like enzyme